MSVAWPIEALTAERAGRPMMIRPRLGQASFRLAVIGAYGGQCAETTEHSLPVIEAAHIRPWAAGGTHEVPNGLPLRRDLHRLFDLGYVTVRPDLAFAVSPLASGVNTPMAVSSTSTTANRFRCPTTPTRARTSSSWPGASSAPCSPGFRASWWRL
jgi:HNH endonuclease